MSLTSEVDNYYDVSLMLPFYNIPIFFFYFRALLRKVFFNFSSLRYLPSTTNKPRSTTQLGAALL